MCAGIVFADIIMASSKPKKKGNKVQLATFMRWDLPTFGFEVEEEDGFSKVVKMWCKVCSKHIDKIKIDGRIRGVARVDIQSFAEGTKFVSKHTAQRHLQSKVGELK